MKFIKNPFPHDKRGAQKVAAFIESGFNAARIGRDYYERKDEKDGMISVLCVFKIKDHLCMVRNEAGNLVPKENTYEYEYVVKIE